MARIPGAPNFRDLGGYPAGGAAVVRRRRLFRSDHLGALSADDIALLRTLGLRKVFDLRGVTEREAAPHAIDDVAIHSLPIEPTIVQKLTDLVAAGHTLTPADVSALMQDTYRGFVRGNTPRFAQLFAHLLESGDPVVFHCTAGKDRTGFAAALILRSLGVGHEDVMRDYLVTNERLRPVVASAHGLSAEALSVLWRVQPEFLLASFEAVEQDYGGLEAYLREGLGLREAERERLRELYLEPGAT